MVKPEINQPFLNAELPKDVAGLLAVGEAAMNQGNAARALECVNSIMNGRPDVSANQREMAMALFRRIEAIKKANDSVGKVSQETRR